MEPPPLRRSDKAMDDSEDGPTNDAPAVPQVGAEEAPTRFPRMAPMTSWAARRVRRLLVPNLGARFGAKGTSSASTSQTVSHVQTQTLPDEDLEETQCRRCRRVYRRRPTIRDEPFPFDQKPWDRSSLVPTSSTTTDQCPGKPAASSWSTRLVESLLAVVAEVLQYPWGADALLLVGIVLLASLLVILYYVVAVVLPIMVLAVALAMANYALFENSRFAYVVQRLRLA